MDPNMFNDLWKALFIFGVILAVVSIAGGYALSEWVL